MNEDTNYITTGLDKFFSRGSSSSEIMEDQASHDVQQISGSNLSSGVTKSSDGKININWNNTLISTNDGARNRVELGKIPGTNLYGLRIYDAEGNIIMSPEGQIQTAGIADDAVTSIKISSLSADKITTGTLQAGVRIQIGSDPSAPEIVIGDI